MSKKQDAYYFDNFCDCAECAGKAAHLLRGWLTEFDPAHIHEKLDEMHALEQEADRSEERRVGKEGRSRRSPYHQEKNILLSQNIDDLTDKIEDVLLRIYCNNVQTIRPDALKLIDVLIRCCGEVKEMLGCFSSFKNVKKLHEHVVNINTLEEEADALFYNSLRELHTTCSDPLTVISWREIYIYLENCVDACEHVADTVESVVMKNT